MRTTTSMGIAELDELAPSRGSAADEEAFPRSLAGIEAAAARRR